MPAPSPPTPVCLPAWVQYLLLSQILFSQICAYSASLLGQFCKLPTANSLIYHPMPRLAWSWLTCLATFRIREGEAGQEEASFCLIECLHFLNRMFLRYITGSIHALPVYEIRYPPSLAESKLRGKNKKKPPLSLNFYGRVVLLSPKYCTSALRAPTEIYKP